MGRRETIAGALPLELTPRAWEVLTFLFEAHPLPISTRTISWAAFTRKGGNDDTAEGRAWKAMNFLRERGLVGATSAPTRHGRPRAHWHLVERGVKALVDTGRVSPEALSAKPRIHKAYENLLARRHDLLVHEFKARLLEMGRMDARILITSIATDESTWTTVPDPTGLAESLSVAPDLVSVVEAGSTRTALLIEVQGTGASTKAATLKVRGYLSYLAAGRLVSDWDCRSARVIFVAFSDDPLCEDHRNNLLEAIAEVRGSDRVVIVTTAHEVAAHGLLAPIFLRSLEYRAALGENEGALGQRERIRHAGNAVRERRNAIVRQQVPLRRWFE